MTPPLGRSGDRESQSRCQTKIKPLPTAGGEQLYYTIRNPFRRTVPVLVPRTESHWGGGVSEVLGAEIIQLWSRLCLFI